MSAKVAYVDQSHQWVAQNVRVTVRLGVEDHFAVVITEIKRSAQRQHAKASLGWSIF